MCHINLIFRKDGKSSKKLSEYMNVVSYYSFLSNSDGEGYFAMNNKADIHFGKGKDKFTFGKSYWLLATHQRLTTSGEGVGNTHPHETKDFILMHNGIISALGNNHKSDSRVFADMLQEEYDNQSKKEKDLAKAVSILTKKISGSYSILIIEKKSGRLLYFKEASTRMSILEDENFIIMSTSYNNVSFGRFFFGSNALIKDVEPLKIYDVLNDMKVITGFEEKSYTYQGYGGLDKDRYFAYGFSNEKLVTSNSQSYIDNFVFDAEQWIKDDR